MIEEEVVGPPSLQTSCGEAPTLGRLCSKHLLRVQAHAGGWDCAWPGCQCLSPAMRGLCAFHAAIARGECDFGGRPRLAATDHRPVPVGKGQLPGTREGEPTLAVASGRLALSSAHEGR